jgi:hypothetical protein
MNSTDPHSSDFSYKKYSLEQLDTLVNDALSCEDLTPEDIYNTIVKCVDDSVEYHKKHLTKSVEFLSLLKGHRPVDFETTQSDWNDFWEENYYPEEHKQYTEEELNEMCDAASDKEKCREYNLREAEYYNKRAELDAKHTSKVDGYSVDGTEHSQYYYDTGRNKTHDQMIAEGWQMTDDGFWIKETDKGIASVSA